MQTQERTGAQWYVKVGACIEPLAQGALQPVCKHGTVQMRAFTSSKEVAMSMEDVKNASQATAFNCEK